MSNPRLPALAGLLVAASLLLTAVRAHAHAGDPTATPTAPAAPAGAKQNAKSKAERIYDDTADAAKEIEAALARARREHTRVLIQWGANWCGWCTKLHATCAKDSDIAKELRDEYEVVLVDIGQFDRNMELAARLGAKLKENGVPFLTILGEDGAPVANRETGSLEDPATKSHDPAKVMALLKSHEAPRLKAGEVLAAGVAKAKAEDKLVFLHFGAPWCGWCHRLEDWMAKPEIAAVLSKAFVAVKVDTDRMEGGQALLVAESKGKNGGIPWCEILDGEGKAIVDSNAPESGNIGFPAKPDEIAWFARMLERAGPRLSAEDVALLTRSLQAPAKGS